MLIPDQPHSFDPHFSNAAREMVQAIISEARNRADEILAEAKRKAEKKRLAIQEQFNELQRQKEEWKPTQVRLDAESKRDATAVERSATTTARTIGMDGVRGVDTCGRIMLKIQIECGVCIGQYGGT